MLKVIEAGHQAFSVYALDPKGREWYGMFASAQRAADWGGARMAGEPYNPIPQAGEA